MKTLTIEQAKSLKHGTILFDTICKNTDGSPTKWRVSGKVRTWKRNPKRIKVPIKHGLYINYYIRESNLERFILSKAG